MDSILKKAHVLAIQARAHSYSPYSKFRVGASLILEGGKIVSGCNVENASFGATICAERNAFFSAVNQEKHLEPVALILVTEPEAVPCGLCLQVMAEFCDDSFPIYLGTPSSLGEKTFLRDLLPRSFRSDSLK